MSEINVKYQKGVSYWMAILSLNARTVYTLQTQEKYLIEPVTANNITGNQS